MAEQEATVTITEKVTCDSGCMSKYKDKDGTFKGGKGEAFKSCVAAFDSCCQNVTDSAALCASLGRKSGKIK